MGFKCDLKCKEWHFVNTYRLFMCQDENEPESFRLFCIKTVTNEPGPQYYDTLKDRFVRHALPPERTKALIFVFVFVFVLAHEQAISKKRDIAFCIRLRKCLREQYMGGIEENKKKREGCHIGIRNCRSKAAEKKAKLGYSPFNRIL